MKLLYVLWLVLQFFQDFFIINVLYIFQFWKISEKSNSLENWVFIMRIMRFASYFYLQLCSEKLAELFVQLYISTQNNDACT